MKDVYKRQVRFLSESVNSLLLQCAQSPEVNKLFLAQKYSGTELYNVKRKLDTLRFNNSKIYSIYVYDKYGKTIFESGEFSQGFESSAEDFYDTGFVEYLDKLDTVKVFTPVVRTCLLYTSTAREKLHRFWKNRPAQLASWKMVSVASSLSLIHILMILP